MLLRPETALRLAAALHAVIGSGSALPARRQAQEPSLGFLVEELAADGNRHELIATASHFDVARAAAYDEAVRQYPKDRRIVLRHGAHMVADTARPRDQAAK